MLFNQVLCSSSMRVASKTRLRTKTLNKRVKRKMNVHEYQGHQIMKSYGVNVPNGWVASSADQAKEIASKHFKENEDIIVKAQVYAGGRGKGKFASGLQGGVHTCLNANEVGNIASQMIGSKLITVQTAKDGAPVSKIYLCEKKHIKRETYLAIMLDREAGGPLVIASHKGGVNIETLAREEPDAIYKEPVDINVGMTDEEADRIASALKFDGDMRGKAAEQIKRLYELFVAKDATMVEVNPFVETNEGEVLCLDAKLNFDSNALFRNTDLSEMKDLTQVDSREMKASKHDLNYIGLDGNIACLVNGAGLAMATMDIIQLYGGKPANFLDIGGGATDTQVTEAFKILSEDERVDAVLVNIFGGIMRCDSIALGIIKAVEQLELKIPIVVRLQGTNYKEALEMLANSGHKLLSAQNLDDAANKAVQVAQIVKLSNEANLNVTFELNQ